MARYTNHQRMKKPQIVLWLCVLLQITNQDFCFDNVTCTIKDFITVQTYLPVPLSQHRCIVPLTTEMSWLTFAMRTFKNEDKTLDLRCSRPRSIWSAMHSQVCREAQRGTGTGFINKPNKGWCRQWPLRCGFGRGGKADVYPEETNKALSVSWEVSQPRIASLERSSALIMSLRGDDHHAAPHIQPRPPSRLTIQSVSENSTSAAHAASEIEKTTYGVRVNWHGDNLQIEKKNHSSDQASFVG